MRIAIIFTAMFWLFAGQARSQISFTEKGLDYFMFQQDWSCGVAIIDLNDDAIAEIVVANNSDRNRLYFRFDTLYTDLAQQYGVNQTNHHHSITIADIDKDIRPDLYISGDPPYSYEGR